jgi:hypothetical protein
VDPAFDFAVFDEVLDASAFPAFDSAALDGFDDRDDFATGLSFHLRWASRRETYLALGLWSP